jgi:hypothetical protein
LRYLKKFIRSIYLMSLSLTKANNYTVLVALPQQICKNNPLAPQITKFFNSILY